MFASWDRSRVGQFEIVRGITREQVTKYWSTGNPAAFHFIIARMQFQTSDPEMRIAWTKSIGNGVESIRER